MGYDLASTYYNRGETKLTKENAAMLKEAWTVNMGGNVYGAPLQIDGKIYASGPTSVRAFDAATGTMLWTSMVGGTGSLAYADGTLYLNNTSGIVAIDAADGQRKWSKPLGSGSDGTASPLVVGDLVVAGASNGGAELTTGNFRGFMAALDRMTGASKWVTYTVPENAHGASMWSSPSADLAAGRVYGSTGNNYGTPATDTSDAFIAFDLMTGNIIWKSQRVMSDTFGGNNGLSGGPDADFGANPVLYETMVGGVMTKVIAAGNKGGEAHAVRAEDGMMLWERKLGPGQADGSSGIFTNSAWTGKYMLFACNNGTNATLFALDGATGEMAWMRQLPGLVWGRTAVANGVGFVGTGTKLEVFDVDTGDLIKSFESKGGTVAGTITVSNGRVAFGEGLTWSSGIRGQTLTVLSLP